MAKHAHITVGQDAMTSAEIRNIRAANGNPGYRCPICSGNDTSPYRRIVDGKITEGCIDAFHTGCLPTGSASKEWHDRQWARKWRMVGLENARALGR